KSGRPKQNVRMGVFVLDNKMDSKPTVKKTLRGSVFREERLWEFSQKREPNKRDEVICYREGSRADHAKTLATQAFLQLSVSCGT
ncbi:MAG: hypothetical protein VZQ55_03615, partial [Ruminococcus sp.]|nr:hypothetical protein [Ruminococcus sp.]